ARTMRFEPAFAEGTDGTLSMRRTGDVDFTGHATTKPVTFLCPRNALGVNDFSDKFVYRRSSKSMISAKDFNVGVADPRHEDSYSRPTRAEPRQGPFFANEFFVCNDE